MKFGRIRTGLLLLQNLTQLRMLGEYRGHDFSPENTVKNPRIMDFTIVGAEIRAPSPVSTVDPVCQRLYIEHESIYR